MSQIFGANLATPETIRAIVGTAAVELVSASNPTPIGKIHLCNVTGAEIAIDLEVYDGTTSYFIEKGRPMAAHACHEVRDEVLQAGEVLRAKSSVLASLHVHVIKAIASR
jgi:hypothetical protein